MINQLLILLIALLFSSCATMINGKTQMVSFWSNDKELQIQINDQIINETQPSIMLRRDKNYTLKILKNEDIIQEYTIERRISWLHLLNIPLYYFSILGLLVDYHTGGLYKLTLVDLYGNDQILKHKDYKNKSELANKLMEKTYAIRTNQNLNIFIISNPREEN